MSPMQCLSPVQHRLQRAVTPREISDVTPSAMSQLAEASHWDDPDDRDRDLRRLPHDNASFSTLAVARRDDQPVSLRWITVHQPPRIAVSYRPKQPVFVAGAGRPGKDRTGRELAGERYR